MKLIETLRSCKEASRFKKGSCQRYSPENSVEGILATQIPIVAIEYKIQANHQVGATINICCQCYTQQGGPHAYSKKTLLVIFPNCSWALVTFDQPSHVQGGPYVASDLDLDCVPQGVFAAKSLNCLHLLIFHVGLHKKGVIATFAGL